MIKAGKFIMSSSNAHYGPGSVIDAGQMCLKTTNGIQLDAGVVINIAGKTICVTSNCTVKELESEGQGILKIMGMDGQVCCYSVGEGFNYPDEAPMHIAGADAAHS